MKLLIALITHNRLEYTKRTLASLKETLKVPHHILIVDNASTDGTQNWIKNSGWGYVLNPENKYPGAACNMGWSYGLELYRDMTHLMRCDNDMEFKPGWDLAAEDYFKKIPELGQLGLDHEAIEDHRAKLREMHINGKVLNPWPGCVGGPNIIRRKLWDEGVRYPELRWDDERRSKLQEDSAFSKEIQRRGYLTGHMTEDLARTFANESNWSEYPEYYKKTMAERGYDENLDKIKEAK